MDNNFLNDTDFMVRNAMERYNGINNFADNTGVTNADLSNRFICGTVRQR